MSGKSGTNRRKVLLGLGGLALAGAAWRYWPEDGFLNPCLEEPLPARLRDHDLVLRAWEGVDPARFRDCHVHLIGTGDSGSGMWVTPDMESLAHPLQWLQRAFYLNASCTADDGRSDLQYLERINRLMDDMPAGLKLLLMSFDWFHGEDGEIRRDASAFHTPNDYAARVARARPDRFGWIASIHPYREDAAEAVRQAATDGAKAVKWLPPAQGMDPASPLCDPFYEAAAEAGIPLLVHAGAELAVHGGNTEDFGNPLRLRRPLDHGVRVIVAHCASLGRGPDLDEGPNGRDRPSFQLFARLMDEPRYEGLLFGDISAVTQLNRAPNVLEPLLERQEWHDRLVNGSDYPLPGILPLFSLKFFERRGLIRPSESEVLSEIRNYNPLFFDFVLKRTLSKDELTFSAAAFQAPAFLL